MVLKVSSNFPLKLFSLFFCFEFNEIKQSEQTRKIQNFINYSDVFLASGTFGLIFHLLWAHRLQEVTATSSETVWHTTLHKKSSSTSGIVQSSALPRVVVSKLLSTCLSQVPEETCCLVHRFPHNTRAPSIQSMFVHHSPSSPLPSPSVGSFSAAG